MRDLKNERTASFALATAREIPAWQKPAPVRSKAKHSQKGKRGFSLRAMFKRGEVAE